MDLPFFSFSFIHFFTLPACITSWHMNADNIQNNKWYFVSKIVLTYCQRNTYRMLETNQMKLILLCFWAEPAILGSTKTALIFRYEILIG